MGSITTATKATRLLERLLAVVGSGICLVVTAILWVSIGVQQSLWPLPGLYFIEMAALGVVCALLAFVADNPRAQLIIWGAIGIISAFSIMGAWSVGFFYLPVAIIFGAIVIRLDLRNKQHIAAHVGVCLTAGIVQLVLMLAAIHLFF